MNNRYLPIFILVFFIYSCWGGNVKYESKDIEKEVRKKRIKVEFEDGFNVDPKYRIYFVNKTKGYFSVDNEVVVVSGMDYELFVSVRISNFSYIVNTGKDEWNVRLDFLSVVDVVSYDSIYLISNEVFSYVFVTNLSFGVFLEPFRKELLFEEIFYKFFDNVALNLVYFVLTGWKEDYGYYTIKDSIIQRLIGGSTNEGISKKTNRRNIPVVGGE